MAAGLDSSNSRITTVVVAVCATKTIKRTREIPPYNIVGGGGDGSGSVGGLIKFGWDKGGRRGKQCVLIARLLFGVELFSFKSQTPLFYTPRPARRTKRPINLNRFPLPGTYHRKRHFTTHGK